MKANRSGNPAPASNAKTVVIDPRRRLVYKPRIMPSKKSSAPGGLKLLGRSQAAFPAKPASSILETFPNRNAGRDYWIRFDTHDFTSLCPVTGQPDFARIEIAYVAGERCIETKSLKFYLASYRNERAFNEAVVNRILDDLAAVSAPRRMLVRGSFSARGGIGVTVEAEYPDSAVLARHTPFSQQIPGASRAD
jgi:7-cyano-7-deazaguanine reductase